MNQFNHQYECLNGHCKTITLDYRNRDGLRCPRCDGPVVPMQFKKNGGDRKFLSIQLDQLGSVPKVFYQGKEITGKVKVKFEWETQTDRPKPSTLCPTIYIEHADKTLIEGLPVLNTISIKSPFSGNDA